MPTSIDPAEFEAGWGLREVTMIRMPTSVWASDDEQARLDLLAESLPQDWPSRWTEWRGAALGFALGCLRLAAANGRLARGLA
jgi:hypothetical protein